MNCTTFYDGAQLPDEACFAPEQPYDGVAEDSAIEQSQTPHYDLQADLDRRYEREQQALREMTLERLSRYEVTCATVLNEPRPILARGKQVIGSEGNLSLIVGEAKSKKSFLCTAIVGDLMKFPPAEPDNGFNRRPLLTLWLDTEQSELHVRKVARRLSQLAAWPDPELPLPGLKLYALREEPPKERLHILRQAIDAYRPKLVVIDGIADLMHNTNDLEESERLVTELMALSSQYACHILCVLHANPNSDKARGHLGSALQRKAETVLYVHKVGERSVVEPQFCRNEPFDRFAFHIEQRTEEGLPAPCELPDQSPQNELIDLVRQLYGGVIERSVLTTKLQELGDTENNARVKISRAIKRGQLHYDEELKLLRVATS